jgi:dihydrolipoamide dehydrogenase
MKYFHSKLSANLKKTLQMQKDTMRSQIVVIGAGPGGYVAAVRAAQNGAKVTVVEKSGVGGTCLNRGCIPSKIMKVTAEMMEDLQQAGSYGIQGIKEFSVDLTVLRSRQENIVKTQAKGIEKLLAHHDIDFVVGEGHIQRQGLLTVYQPGGDVKEVPWDRLIISTGTEPLRIPSFPFDGRNILSSDDVLRLDSVPHSMVIIGGGVIGCEFACIMSALGSKITVVEALDRILPLPAVDEMCSKVLKREMKKRKIKILVNQVVKAVDSTDNQTTVEIGTSSFAQKPAEHSKKPLTVTADKVLVCIGRSPNTSGMGLDKIGIAVDDRGWIVADDKMQTSNPHVFAIGDVLGPDKVMLAHVASAEGLVAADNATGSDRHMDYGVIPSAVFTMPEVATVGLTEAQAMQQGHNTRADSVLFRSIGKAQAMGALAGEAKIVSDVQSKKVLGVHLIGAHATDLIAEGALAIQAGLTTQDLANTIHAHPTLAEIMFEMSLKSIDKPLHK